MFQGVNYKKQVIISLFMNVLSEGICINANTHNTWSHNSDV